MKIVSYCSNRTVFPPPSDIVAANAEVMRDISTELIKRGHDLTIYASKGSHLNGAKIVDLDLPPHQLDWAYVHEEWVKDVHAGYRMMYLGALFEDSAAYDIAHLHVGRVMYGEPFTRFSQCPVVFTIHEQLVDNLGPIMRHYREANLISISNSQRRALPDLNYVATIYHGINYRNYRYVERPANRFTFLSRVSKEKGVEYAIAAAEQAGEKLAIYGPGDKEYLDNSVKPHLNSHIHYQGMAAKYSDDWFSGLGDTRALIFPIQWDEPFGLVMIEAMACGTPIIAFNKGSVSEVVEDGKTGFICPPNDIAAMVRAMKKIQTMSESEYQAMRQACRAHVEKNLSVERMVDDYEKVYAEITEQWRRQHSRPRPQ